MNTQYINITPKNKVKYPLHIHPVWEILYYLDGKGYLATEKGNLPFEKGKIIIVPPNTVHGTVSENGFTNISMGGEYNHIFRFDTPVSLSDTPTKEGETLARLILNNRYANSEYVSALSSAYIQFILQNVRTDTRINRTIQVCITEIQTNFSDPGLNVTKILNKNGYVEDYIRAEFKRVTGDTPTVFLTKIRIAHAKKLFEIYGNGISVTEVAEACGFTDPVYFSKRFKAFAGISPDRYRKEYSFQPKLRIPEKNTSKFKKYI